MPGIFFLLLIALLPAGVSWWFGRRLARRIDDAALPELLAAHRRRNGTMFGVAIPCLGWVAMHLDANIVVAICAGGVVAWAGLIAAAYPLRRAVYQETWTFPTYCSFYPRTFLGLFGFWIALAALPGVASLAGAYDWLAGLTVAAALWVWNDRNADVVRWSLRSQHLPDGETLTECRSLAEAASFPLTRFEFIDLRGGVVANALALPSLRGSSVIFTDTLLQRFDLRELRAICAHELAHFEHYNPVYLRRLTTVNRLLIAAAAAWGPAARAAGMEWGMALAAVWLGLLVVSIAMRARGKQRQETACDLRAAELTSDPESVVRALTKLYAIARLPRRLDRQHEQSATHPSLARRIRDIRKAAGWSPAALPGAMRFTDNQGTAAVTFDHESVKWEAADGVTIDLPYGCLTELRVSVRSGRSQLTALHADSRRWELHLSDADVPRLQSVLDVVDGRLSDPIRPRALPARTRRMIVIGSATAMLVLSQGAVAVVAVLAWLKPTAPFFLAAGLAALSAAALAARQGALPLVLIGLPLVTVGVVFLAFAWSERRSARAGEGPFLAALAFAAGCAVVAAAAYGFDVVSVYRGARAVPSATALLVALATVLVCSPVRRGRLTGAAVGLLALASAAAGSDVFLQRFADDAFVMASPPLRPAIVTAAAIQSFDVPADASRIDLSPDGRYVAIHQDVEEDGDHPPTVQVGRIGEVLSRVPADDVAFVSNEEMLVVRSDSHGTTLQVERLGPSREVVWQRAIQDLSSPALLFDFRQRQFDVVGWKGDSDLVQIEGLVGATTVSETRWPVAQGQDGYVAAMAASGPEALVLQVQHSRSPLARAIPWRWTWAHVLLPVRSVARYAALTRDGRRIFGESRLDVHCAPDGGPERGLACAAYDGTRTRIVTIAAGTGRVKAVGTIEGQFFADDRVVGGWLCGWGEGRPLAIRLSTGEAFQMPRGTHTYRLLAVSGDRLAALTVEDDGVTVRVYGPLSDTRSADAAPAQDVTGADGRLQ